MHPYRTAPPREPAGPPLPGPPLRVAIAVLAAWSVLRVVSVLAGEPGTAEAVVAFVVLAVTLRVPWADRQD